MTEQEYWNITPFEFYLEAQAAEMKFKRENLINIQLYNLISAFMGGNSIGYDDVFGYKTSKDYKLKTIEDFREKGKINIDKWNKYFKETIKPAKRELGLEG